MPCYDYRCPANGVVAEVRHPMSVRLRYWMELCYAAQLPLGDTDPMAPVEKVISAPRIAIPVGNTTLREKGFTKLVRRDDGVYENVTAIEGESRYVRRGERDTLPHIHRKVGD